MMKLNYTFLFIIYHITAYDMNCPVPSERNMRSKTVCADYRNYTCLFDENTNSFNESCFVRSDFQRPGYRVTLRTNIHARACEDDLYQPFIFYTNTSSDCEMQRSFCSEKGQVVSNHGTIKTDRQCRCNYAEGYTYVTTPTNICSCIPSLEDCSCYRKTCPENYIFSPDYKCIDQFIWSGQFLCSSISDLRIPISNVSKNTINSKTAKEDFSREIPGTFQLLIVPPVLLLIFSIVIVMLQDKIPGIQLYSSNSTLGVTIRGRGLHDTQFRLSLQNDLIRNIQSRDEGQVELESKEEQKELNECIEIPGTPSSSAQGTISLTNIKESITTQANMEIITGEEHSETLKMIGSEYLSTKVTNLAQETCFLKTDVFTKVKEKLAARNCMLLWGKSGCGKTTSLYYIAMYLQQFGYKPVTCHEPSDILKHQCKNKKQTFVIDDICGRFVYSYKKVLTWMILGNDIKRLLQYDNVKILMACSRVVFMNDTVQEFSLFKDNAIEIPINNILQQAIYTSAEYSHGSLPLSDELSCLQVSSTYYISKVEELRNTNRAAFCALVICVLKTGCIDKADLKSDGNHVFSELCRDVSNALHLDMSQEHCLYDLIVLMDIFLSKENGSLFIKNATVFEALAVYFGKELQNVFLEYADPEIIIQHCSLSTCSIENENFSIQVTEENEHLYFQRKDKILSSGDVFSARQLRLLLYQQKFAAFFPKSSDKMLA